MAESTTYTPQPGATNVDDGNDWLNFLAGLGKNAAEVAIANLNKSAEREEEDEIQDTRDFWMRIPGFVWIAVAGGLLLVFFLLKRR